MMRLVLDRDCPYSINGVTVIEANAGDKIDVPDDLAESLIAAGFGHVPRGRKPKFETPESQAEVDD